MRGDYNLSSIVKFCACSTSSCYWITISNNRWSINWIGCFFPIFSSFSLFTSLLLLQSLYSFLFAVSCRLCIALKLKKTHSCVFSRKWREISSAFIVRNGVSITNAFRWGFHIAKIDEQIIMSKVFTIHLINVSQRRYNVQNEDLLRWCYAIKPKNSTVHFILSLEVCRQQK